MQVCQAKEFVQKLDKGLDEYVGSLGEKLSGGQKQRLAIARTLIRKPSVYLFDEATSALDRRNESAIQKTLERIAANCTSLTVAHRLVTVRNCDIIVALKDGQVLETGSHQQLISKPNGYYKSLIDKQGNVEEKYEDDGEDDE